MPEGRKRLSAAWRETLAKKQDRPNLFPAMLGAYVDGVPQIKVIDRPDFVWCRLRGSTSEVVQAVNEAVGLHWDLPILIYRDPLNPAFWKVYGRDIAQYASWEGASYLPPHGDAHSFSASSNTGVDPVWVFKRQYMPLLPHPVISGANGIYIEPDFYYWGGRFNWWPGSGTASLLGNRPTGALNGAFVTVYLEGASRTLQTIKGPEFPVWYPSADASEFITLPSPLQGIPLAAVFLTTGSTSIGWGEIYDLRMPAEALGNELVTGSVVLRNEGAILGSVTTLDFVGGLVDASVSGTYGRILISGSTGGGGSAVLGPGTGCAYYMQVGLAIPDGGDYFHVPDAPYVTGSLTVFVNGLAQRIGIDYVETDPTSGTFQYLASPPTGASHLALWAKLVEGGAIASGTVQVWDEGIPLGSFNTLEFVGPNVEVTASGTHARIFITGAAGSVNPPITGTIVGLDEGRTLGSFTRVNFRGPGVVASASGSYLDVNVPAPGVDQIGVMAWDDGIPIGTGTTLDFIGAGVVATRSGTVIAVTIPGGGGGGGGGVDQIGVYALQNGVPLGTGTWLDVGDNLLGSLSGTTLRLDAIIPPEPPEQIGVMAWDSGVPIGTGTVIDFGRNLTAILSGTVLEVHAVGAAGDTFFLRSSGSDVGSYEYMLRDHGIQPEVYYSSAIGATGSLIQGFITPPGAPLLDFLNDGIYHVHLHGNRTAGTMNVRLVWQLFRYTVGGQEIPLLVSELSNVLTDSEAEYDMEAASLEIDVEPSDRLLLKVLGQRFGGGSGPTASIGIEGLTSTRLEIPAVPNANSVITTPVTGSVVLREEGVVLGSVTTLDLRGPGVVGSISGGYGIISVSGAGDPPTTGTVVGLDEGATLGSFDRINFRGAGVSAVASGTYLDVDVPGAGTATLAIWDDGVPLGPASTLDFGPGLTASLSGSVAQITAQPPTPRAGVCLALGGNYYLAPDFPFVTGSLMVFANGVAQRPGVDYAETYSMSGVFQFTSTPATGSVVVAMWGKA